MLDGFVVDQNRSGHPDLSIRMAWSVQVPTVVHFESSSDSILAALAQTTRASIVTAAAGKSSLRKLVSQTTKAVNDAAAAIGGESGEHRKTIGNFLTDIDRLDCKACTRRQASTPDSLPPICCHDALEDPLVVAHPDNDPVCLHFATEMFEKLVARASSYYAALSNGHSKRKTDTTIRIVSPRDERLLTLTFLTMPTTTGAVDGSTRFPQGDARGARKAEVTLQLPAELNPKALSELPYIMFHEIFVHGPESWGCEGQRIATRSSCAMREGFVDAAAAFVLSSELSLKGLSFSALPHSSEWLAAGVLAAQRMRSSPVHMVAAGSSKRLATLRLNGSMMFDRYTVRNLGKTGAALAAAINLFDLSEADRGAYLGILGEAALLMDPEPSDLSTHEYRLAARLRQIADRRPLDFVALKNVLEEWKMIANSDF